MQIFPALHRVQVKTVAAVSLPLSGGVEPPESRIRKTGGKCGRNERKTEIKKEETGVSSRLVNFALPMYKQLTSGQRYTISVLLQKKYSKSEIAEALGVSNSTITRELRRNSSSRGVYRWDKAQRQADRRRHRAPGNRSVSPYVRNMAIDLLRREQWSPCQISGYLAGKGCQNLP